MSKKARGKTPSLIGSSLGRPKMVAAGKRTPCSRCGADIAMGDKCFDVPRPDKPFNSSRRFCTECFSLVLEQTKTDLALLETL